MHTHTCMHACMHAPKQRKLAFSLVPPQEKKRLVFESTVGGSNEALARLTEADMRFLFT